MFKYFLFFHLTESTLSATLVIVKYYNLVKNTVIILLLLFISK